MDYEEEENLTVYIEELKSDDPGLKVNAAQKITAISKILGQNRTEHELIPFLQEILEECDNDEEFLIVITQQLRELDKYISPDKVHILLAPLEIISSMEDPQVRQLAIDNLIDLLQEQSQEFYIQRVLPMVKQLATWDHYNSRISASSLIPQCYENVSEQGQNELIDIFTKLSTDDTPMVRRAAVKNIYNFLNLATQEHKTKLVELWFNLIKDKFDSVKIAAIEAIKQILEFLEKSTMTNITTTLDNLPNTSWRVKYSIVESLPILFEKSNDKNQLLTIFKKLLHDRDMEVKSIAIQKIPEVAIHISKNLFEQNIYSEFDEFLKDPQYHVRSSVGSIMPQIYNRISQNTQENSYFELIQRLFNDQILDVKQSILSLLSDLTKIMGQTLFLQNIVPLLIDLSNDPNWRSRLLVCEQLPVIFKNLPFEKLQTLNPLMKKLKLDNYYGIRLQYFQNYQKLFEAYPYDAILDKLKDDFQSLIDKGNYLYRITALQAVCHLKEVIQPEDIQTIWDKFFSNMINDKVSNVKLNVLKTYLEIESCLSQNQKNNIKTQAQRLKQYDDEDIAQFANQITQS